MLTVAAYLDFADEVAGPLELEGGPRCRPTCSWLLSADHHAQPHAVPIHGQRSRIQVQEQANHIAHINNSKAFRETTKQREVRRTSSTSHE